MARCLVTGHKGYIGSKLYQALLDEGHDVIGIDLKSEIPHDILVDLKEGSDGKFHPYWYNFKPEYIFHLACWPRVAYSIEKPVATAINNILSNSIMLNFARKVGSVKRFIYSSSSSVVGNGSGPESPYALQKYTAEVECTLYSKLYNLDTVALRYFNVYSPDQKVDGAYATAVANWMKFIREGEDPYITGDGEQRRDMVNVADVVSANIFAMNHSEKLSGQVFDVGTGENISLNELKDIVQELQPHVNFEYKPERPGDVGLTRANTEPLKKIGWHASISIRDGMIECFKDLM
jgi:nucleoside-diphosphate-sugar epimerase